MTQTINQIRSLLDRLENEIELTRESASVQALSGLELPEIMRDIIDLLFPHITPYQAAIYMYLLRSASTPVSVKEQEVDYYNIRENRLKIYERDNYTCRHCGKQLTRFTSTLDHVTPGSKGGDNTLDNLVTSCLDCNSKKNARLLGDFMADTNPS